MVAKGQTLPSTCSRRRTTFEHHGAAVPASAVPVEYLKVRTRLRPAGAAPDLGRPYRITSYVRHKSRWCATRPGTVPLTPTGRRTSTTSTSPRKLSPGKPCSSRSRPAPRTWSGTPSRRRPRCSPAAEDRQPRSPLPPDQLVQPVPRLQHRVPNENGALGKIPVRRAISEGVNTGHDPGVRRTDPQQPAAPGPAAGHQRWSVAVPQFNPSTPYNATKAKTDSRRRATRERPDDQAAVPQPVSRFDGGVPDAAGRPAEDGCIHVTGVPVDDATLRQVPAGHAEHHVEGRLGPGAARLGERTGTATRPAPTCRRSSTVGRSRQSSSNFGDFNDPKVNKLNDQALAAPTADQLRPRSGTRPTCRS